MISLGKALPLLVSLSQTPLDPERYKKIVPKVQAQVAKKIDDPNLEQLLSESYTGLWNRARANVDAFKENVAECIRDYFSSPQCRRNRLPSSIKGANRELDLFDLSRVLYIYEPVEQNNGWICGYRALVNAATISKILKDHLPVTHDQISSIAQSFFDKDGSVSEFITYLGDQKKIASALKLLKNDFEKVEKARTCLQNNDLRLTVLALQENFFILKVAHKLLSQRETLVDGLSLLGKGTQPPVKKAGLGFLESLLAKVRTHNEKALEALVQDFCGLPDMPREISRLVSLERNTLHSRESKVCCILLGIGGVSERKELRNWRTKNVAVDQSVSRLIQGLSQVLGAVEVTDEERAAFLRKLDFLTHLRLAKVVELLSAQGRIKVFVENIDRESCPKVISALALMETENFGEYWEIIDYIKVSQAVRVQEVLQSSSSDLNEHDELQKILREVNGENQSDLDAQFDRIIARLRALKTPSNEATIDAVCTQLQDIKKKDIDNLRSRFTINLNEMDQKRTASIVYKIFKECNPALKYPSENRHDVESLLDTVVPQEIKDAIELLEQEDPKVQEACRILAAHSTPHKKGIMRILESSATTFGDSLRALREEKDHDEDACNELAQLARDARQEGQLATEADLQSLLKCKKFELDPKRVIFVGGLLGEEQGPYIKETSSIRPNVSFDERAILSSEQISRSLVHEIKRTFMRLCIQSTDPVSIHFLCSSRTPQGAEHWIDLSLVRYSGHSPILILIDSLNCPVQGDRSRSLGTDSMLYYVYTSFIA